MKENKNEVLVGSTGFVGGNILQQHDFANAVHSSNVSSIFGTEPDLCIYAGVPSAMFLANNDPDADLAIMEQARENIRGINPSKLVLISTIAIYPDSKGRNENSPIEDGKLSAYGANRLALEQWVREDCPDALVVRLPALYGNGLKKNFIKDMISIAPPLLSAEKYEMLSKESPLVLQSYSKRDDGFYALTKNAPLKELKAWFDEQEFNALSFTDSRSKFQFYGLSRLWADIENALENEYPVFNLATPPVSAAEVFEYVRGRSWKNELGTPPFDYDMHTLYGADDSPYLCSTNQELEDIKRFVGSQS